MVGQRRESEAMAHQRGSAVAQLLQSMHGGALLEAASPPAPPAPAPRRPAAHARRLSLDSCRHQQGKTRVYVRSKECNPLLDPVGKVE
ncbi:hypothetical protein ACOMHN_056485 [Nucella lapillus]